jgi:hypothetical protein
MARDAAVWAAKNAAEEAEEAARKTAQQAEG